MVSGRRCSWFHKTTIVNIYQFFLFPLFRCFISPQLVIHQVHLTELLVSTAHSNHYAPAWAIALAISQLQMKQQWKFKARIESQKITPLCESFFLGLMISSKAPVCHCWCPTALFMQSWFYVLGFIEFKAVLCFNGLFVWVKWHIKQGRVAFKHLL